MKNLLCLLLALALCSGPAASAVKWASPASAHPAVHYDEDRKSTRLNSSHRP